MGQCVFLFGQKSNFNCAGLDPHVRKIRPLDGQENEPDFDQLRMLFSCRRVLSSVRALCDVGVWTLCEILSAVYRTKLSGRGNLQRFDQRGSHV